MPSLPDNEQPCNPHLAALVAINIVSQVLDEAEDIVNTANDSGKSWRYVWRQKKGKGEFYDNSEMVAVVDIKVDGSDTNNCEIIQSENVIVTSTPQKEIDDTTKTYNESGFIGQGDEDIQMRNTGLRSPSMLINCLFDMSEVEQGGTIDFDDVQIHSDSRDFLASTVAKLVESYVNLALNTVCVDVMNPEVMAKSFEGSSNSSYSLLTDAMVSDDTENENATYYINSVKSEEDKEQFISPKSVKMANDEDSKEITKSDIDMYEKTFLTLNRDYDKYSEEEDFPADGKVLVMQEVELPTNKTSEKLPTYSEPTQEEDPVTSTKVIGADKCSLVKRCRLQGAKLMTRLRSWWWRQRLIGKRKGCRSGMCPLSPEARNRAASLLDHRKLRSPSPSQTVAWKFNTVNEALIHSYNLKDFELEINRVPVEKD